MTVHMAHRAFFCGATSVGLYNYRGRQQALPRYNCPLLCAASSSSNAPPVLSPSLNLPRAAFIRKNTNSVASEYELGESIVGEGAYSTVVIGKNKYSGMERAIKVIPKTTTDAEAFEIEIESLMALDHPHIVKILQYFDEGDNFYIVFELIDGPDLVQYVIQRVCTTEQHVPEEELSIILRQVLKAILSCHKGGIIHRDVKLENFMIAGEEKVVKMIDLGLAAGKDDTDAHPLIMGNSVMGTYRYMAPEIYFSSQRYNTAVDMWALGVSFYTMLSLETLLPDGEDEVRKLLSKPKYVEHKIKQCKVLKERKLSKDARNFLNRLLAYDPDKRLTAEEALQHPFIALCGAHDLHTTQTPRKINSANLRKMMAFAEAPPLKRIALLAISHTISQCQDHELAEVRLMFRKLNTSGNGHLGFSELAEGLERSGVTLPANFKEVFAACSSSGDSTVNFNEFIACNLPDCFLNEQLCSAVFRMLDRDGNSQLGAEDFKIMYASGGAEAPEICKDIVRQATGKASITSAEFCKYVLA